MTTALEEAYQTHATRVPVKIKGASYEIHLASKPWQQRRCSTGAIRNVRRVASGVRTELSMDEKLAEAKEQLGEANWECSVQRRVLRESQWTAERAIAAAEARAATAERQLHELREQVEHQQELLNDAQRRAHEAETSQWREAEAQAMAEANVAAVQEAFEARAAVEAAEAKTRRKKEVTLQQLTREAEERAHRAEAECARLQQQSFELAESIDQAHGRPQSWTRNLFESIAAGAISGASVLSSWLRGDGCAFTAHRLDPSSAEYDAVAGIIRDANAQQAHNLGIGKDVPMGPWRLDLDLHKTGDDGHRRSLQLSAVWSIRNPELWRKFKAEEDIVSHDLHRMPDDSPYRHALPTDLDGLVDGLHLDPPLNHAANEKLLLHGTKPEVLFQILNKGLSDKYSGGIFGDGLYFAETIAKNDQYVRADANKFALKDLHRELYGSDTVDHPAETYYVLLCRVQMGCHVRTQRKLPTATRKRDYENIDRPGTSIWGVHKRELCEVSGQNDGARIHHHALLAETLPLDQGGIISRHREFVQFHKERVYPWMLLAYHRVLDGKLLRSG